jgi:hypothetical protein
MVKNVKSKDVTQCGSVTSQEVLDIEVVKENCNL